VAPSPPYRDSSSSRFLRRVWYSAWQAFGVPGLLAPVAVPPSVFQIAVQKRCTLQCHSSCSVSMHLRGRRTLCVESCCSYFVFLLEFWKSLHYWEGSPGHGRASCFYEKSAFINFGPDTRRRTEEQSCVFFWRSPTIFPCRPSDVPACSRIAGDEKPWVCKGYMQGADILEARVLIHLFILTKITFSIQAIEEVVVQSNLRACEQWRLDDFAIWGVI